eukprot:1821056-Prymnesium_polylepis.1
MAAPSHHRYCVLKPIDDHHSTLCRLWPRAAAWQLYSHWQMAHKDNPVACTLEKRRVARGPRTGPDRTRMLERALNGA